MRKEKNGIAHFKIYFFLKTLKLYVYFHVQLYSFHLLNCLKFRLTLLQYKSQNTLINIHIISYYKSLPQISSMYITSESLQNNTLKTSKKKKNSSVTINISQVQMEIYIFCLPQKQFKETCYQHALLRFQLKFKFRLGAT